MYWYFEKADYIYYIKMTCMYIYINSKICYYQIKSWQTNQSI